MLLQRSLAYVVKDLSEEPFASLGRWCGATSRAVASFREDQNLTEMPSASVDQELWRALYNALEARIQKEAEKKEWRKERDEELQREKERILQEQTQDSAGTMKALEMELLADL